MRSTRRGRAGSVSVLSSRRELAKSAGAKRCLFSQPRLPARLRPRDRAMPMENCVRSWRSSVICARAMTTRPVSRPAQPARPFASSPRPSLVRQKIFSASASSRKELEDGSRDQTTSINSANTCGGAHLELARFADALVLAERGTVAHRLHRASLHRRAAHAAVSRPLERPLARLRYRRLRAGAGGRLLLAAAALRSPVAGQGAGLALDAHLAGLRGYPGRAAARKLHAHSARLLPERQLPDQCLWRNQRAHRSDRAGAQWHRRALAG